MMSEAKRLYRSRDNRMIGGVAGGLGEYLGMDPTIVRLIFILLAFGVGSGVLAYLVMMLVVPEEPLGEE
jgi:phage shock protein C